MAVILQKTTHSVYNWAKWWRADGLAGLLNESKSGASVKLTAVMLDTAAEIATISPLTLAMVRHHVQKQHSDAPDFSLFRLAAALKKRVLLSSEPGFAKKMGCHAFLTIKKFIGNSEKNSKSVRSEIIFPR